MPRGAFADPEREAERRRKISEARKKLLAERGYVNSPETRQRIGEAGKGRLWTVEQREKIVSKKKGRRPANFEAMLAKSHALPKPKGQDSPFWKGDAVGYGALHAWVRKVKGAPQRCEECGDESKRRYEWANISMEYRRDPDDWIRLCVSCHRKRGYQSGEYPVVFKGTHTQTNTGRTHIRPGQHLSPSTQFKPGQPPTRKYLE